MAPGEPFLPTASELEILTVLWARGPSTVREVYRAMAEQREIGYSTVLKFMQIMTEKGLLLRDESVRPQRYRTSQPQQRTQRSMLRDLVARAFNGSAASLVLHALSDRRSTPEERRQIRALLDAQDRKRP